MAEDTPDVSPSPQRKTVAIRDLAPQSWFSDRTRSSVWVRGYRVFRVPVEALAEGARTLDLGDKVRGILLHGTVRYVEHGLTTPRIITENRWDFGTIEERETPEGVYLLLVTPFDVDGSCGDEAAAKLNLSVAAGLLTCLKGRNIVFELLFDNVHSLGENRVQGATPAIENPWWSPAPDVTDGGIRTMEAVARAIGGLAPPDRERLRLSLHWFEAASRDSGHDAFLKYWIALETMGMPDTTSIKPLVDTLARAYGLSSEEAARRFMIGRVFGLRSRMVHQGELLSIHGNLIKYLQAVYVDILFEILNLKSQACVARLSAEPGFQIETYLM